MARPKPYLSLKLDSQKIDDLPLPRPLVEIFVHSPRVDAVHLRGGRVARGGLRWSDSQGGFPHRNSRADEVPNDSRMR